MVLGGSSQDSFQWLGCNPQGDKSHGPPVPAPLRGPPAPSPPAPLPPAVGDLPEDYVPPGVAFQQLRSFVTDNPVFDLDYIVAPLLPAHLRLVSKRWSIGSRQTQ